MTTTDARAPGVLHADDPNYRQFLAASQFEPNDIARQFAGMLVASCPRDVRHDPTACADHLQGVMAAHGITELVTKGQALAEPHLADADEALDDLMAANVALESVAGQRRTLPDEVVDAQPNRAGRGAIRRQLAQNQHIAAQRELVGDFEHRRPGSPGWIGWVVASIVAVIETVVTLRIFNVDLTRPGVGVTTSVAGADRRSRRLQSRGRRLPRREATHRPRDQGCRGPPATPADFTDSTTDLHPPSMRRPGLPIRGEWPGLRHPRIRSGAHSGPSGWPWRSTASPSSC